MSEEDPPRPLTLAFVRRVTRPGRYHDRDGLFLTVSPGGGKSWTQRITILGRRRDIGLGSAHKVTPAQARRAAARNREIARAGVNPLRDAPRKTAPAERPMTLARLSLLLYRRRRADGAGLREARADYALIRRHLTPLIGRRPVREISAEEIRAALGGVARGSSATAEAVRLRLARLLDEAVADGHRSDNPARTEAARPPKRRRVTSEGDARNERLLSELPRFLADLEGSGRRPSLLLYVRFALLSLRNPKECRLATWSQMDLDGRTWRFPKMQREGAQEVVLPLHDGMMEILDRARALGRGDRSGWVFPSPLDLNAPYSMHAAQHVSEEFGYEVRMRDFVRVHAYWAEREPEPAAGGLPAWTAHLRSPRS
jgi:hypothetical protein